MCFSHSKLFAAGHPPLPARASKSIVCYVTDRKILAGDTSVAALLDKIRASMAAGVDWVQIREKDLPTRELVALARGAVAAGSARVIINDRVDVALAAGAAGVHLGHASVPAREVVRWCRAGNAPGDFLIGVSCHSLEGAREAQDAGASYTYFGPIYETPSKIPFGVPHGVKELAAVCEAVKIPVIAIGGVNESNAAECLRAGAAGIAAIRMVQGAPDAVTLKQMLEKIRRWS
jgi:thiamine-phosphate pyrophosphorylase